MRLLIVTQAVDRRDPILGFMHGWIAEIATKCEGVIAVGLKVGDYRLPENVEVRSLGKEKQESRWRYLCNFYRHIWETRGRYDAVLVHMNHEYVLLGGIPWRFLGKRIALWYAHGHVPRTLRFAERLTHTIVTSTPNGFRIPSRKVRIIGQGIDPDRFGWVPRRRDARESFRLIVVGRLSPVKDLETTLRALAVLVATGGKWELEVIGEETTPGYRATLEALAGSLGLTRCVRFLGAMQNVEIPARYAWAHCFVHSSQTGSLDKAVGEAMATGLPVVTSSEAMREVLGDEWECSGFFPGNAEEMAWRIQEVAGLTDEEYVNRGKRARAILLRGHSLRDFAGRLLRAIEDTGSTES